MSSNMLRTMWIGLWKGHTPLAGHYHSKADFLAHTFEGLATVLPGGVRNCTFRMCC
jgi:uncharacterized protein YjlB